MWVWNLNVILFPSKMHINIDADRFLIHTKVHEAFSTQSHKVSYNRYKFLLFLGWKDLFSLASYLWFLTEVIICWSMTCLCKKCELILSRLKEDLSILANHLCTPHTSIQNDTEREHWKWRYIIIMSSICSGNISMNRSLIFCYLCLPFSGFNVSNTKDATVWVANLFSREDCSCTQGYHLLRSFHPNPSIIWITWMIDEC